MGMKVPYAGVIYDENELRNVHDAASNFFNVYGKYNEEFANALCDFMGMKYCVLCNSGSSANLLAVTALEFPEDSEIITPACGFPTTLNPIIQNRITPVFVDVKRDTLTIDISALERALSGKTYAIVAPHTLGNPSDMREIMSFVEKYGLYLIEDNCDGLGSRYEGKLTGTFGDISTLSFYPAHHITTGEGGACLTDNRVLYERMLSYSNWGRDCHCKPGQDNACGRRFNQDFVGIPKGYDHKCIFTRIGYNLKMTNIQAAIGAAQIKKLPQFIDARRRNFNALYEGLKKYSDAFDFVTANGEPSWFGFPIICKFPINRQSVVDHLESCGIATRPMFGGNLLKHKAYGGIPHRIVGGLKNTDDIMENMFWIGVYPGIKQEQVDYMIASFDSFMKGA